ncbi:MAG TPA: 3'(2'),5'-bisphosphate nucleotidase CysQ [Hyphomicrobiaceae bacterium]|jgi:3'(2'), 5'-bisphosphate nucleotidase|nr:3'(2'),5'-bisphosphate nucleotidase CysQ [Hyphomicrobiaceae bacterium]
MHASEFRRLAEALLGVTLAAGRIQMAHFKTGVAVHTKVDHSPVTVADRESEAVILEALARIAPGVPVVSEEAASVGKAPKVEGTFFLVDPLDGTRPYIRGEPQFTINIGLIEAGRPTFGLIYAPARGELYVTLGQHEAATAVLPVDASPAALADCGLHAIRTQPPGAEGLRALTSNTHLNEATLNFLGRYKIAGRKAMSSSIKFCLLARGEADVYPRLGETSEWDTAAGHAVLAAAGGTVTAPDGGPLLYAKPKFLNSGFVAWAGAPVPAA